MSNEILESISLAGEQWKPTKKWGKIIPDYLVSNYGRVFSLKRNIILKLQNNTHKERGNSTTVGLSIPKDWSPDYKYANNTLVCQVHQLVVDAFMPIDDCPPEELSDAWHELITDDMIGQPRIPESWKKWIRNTVIIDHINNNPFDNKLGNFRYTTPIQNNTHRKKKIK